MNGLVVLINHIKIDEVSCEKLDKIIKFFKAHKSCFEIHTIGVDLTNCANTHIEKNIVRPLKSLQ